MSVLNQMLQDLERRGAVDEAAARDDEPYKQRAAPVVRLLALPRKDIARGSKLIRGAVWTGAAAVVAATVAGHFWYEQRLDEYARAPQPLGARQFAALAPITATPVAQPPVESTTAPPADGDAGNRSTHKSVPVDTLVARPEQRETMPTATRELPPPSLRPQAADTPKARIATTERGAQTNDSAPARSAAQVSARPATAPATSTLPPSDTSIVTRPANPVAALEARAAELISRGRNVEAMTVLAQVLQQAPDHGKARATLAALQAESGRRDLALQTLLVGSTIEPARFAALAARLQIELGDAGAALSTLDRVPEAARDAAHEALAGGIAQRAGDHSRAVDDYKRALRASNAPSHWWVGLAISLEALNQSAAALDAYRRATADSRLPAAARSYALGRIDALSAVARADPTNAADSAILSARQ